MLPQVNAKFTIDATHQKKYDMWAYFANSGVLCVMFHYSWRTTWSRCVQLVQDCTNGMNSILFCRIILPYCSPRVDSSKGCPMAPQPIGSILRRFAFFIRERSEENYGHKRKISNVWYSNVPAATYILQHEHGGRLARIFWNMGNWWSTNNNKNKNQTNVKRQRPSCPKWWQGPD